MTQQDKDLVLHDLSSRLPYGIKVQHQREDYLDEIQAIEHISRKYGEIETESVLGFVDDFKPYLRSMLSMTEEEVEEYNQCWEKDRDDIMIIGKHFEEMYKNKKFTLYMHPVVPMYRHILWLLKNHFDFMGLIPKGLAIEITEENNPYKE